MKIQPELETYLSDCERLHLDAEVTVHFYQAKGTEEERTRFYATAIDKCLARVKALIEEAPKSIVGTAIGVFTVTASPAYVRRVLAFHLVSSASLD